MRAGYAGVDALHGVDLVVPRRSVVALLGPNGAGKTTTLRVISGEITPTAGCVHVVGSARQRRPPRGARPGRRVHDPRGPRRVPQPHRPREPRRWPPTPVRATSRHVEEVAYARFPRLAERRSQVAGTLSGGEQQMLALARGLAVDPAVLLLDELSMGPRAPRSSASSTSSWRRSPPAGVSVLVVEQFAWAVLEVADYAAVMRQGRIVAVGEPDDVAEELSEAYLGA